MEAGMTVRISTAAKRLFLIFFAEIKPCRPLVKNLVGIKKNDLAATPHRIYIEETCGQQPVNQTTITFPDLRDGFSGKIKHSF
jgi:hypothetical protein